MTLRVGIVSAAWGAFAHLPAWRAIPGVEVTAICTSRRETAEAAAERHDIARPLWDAQAMCADADIDIIDCGTRPAVRLPMVLAALANGKHVYNACPHAPDWSGAQAIDAAWRGSGCIGAVDAFSRWLPAHRKMQALIADGFVGAVQGGRCTFALSLFNRPDRRFPYNWFVEAGQGVSALRNNGSHILYLLIELLGPVAEVTCDDRRLIPELVFEDGERTRSHTTDDAQALLRFESGATIALHASWSQPAAAGWTVDLFGNAGRLVATSPSFPTSRECTLSGGRTGDPLAPIALDLSPEAGITIGLDAVPPPAYPMALAMKAMVDAVGSRSAAVPDFALALEVERTLEGLRRASAERRWISLEEIV